MSVNHGQLYEVSNLYTEYCSLHLRHLSTKKRKFVGMSNSSRTKPKSYQTFIRYLTTCTNLHVQTGCSTSKGRGALVTSMETVHLLVSSESTNDSEKQWECPSPYEIQAGFKLLTERYGSMSSTYQEGNIDWPSEIKAVPLKLWIHFFLWLNLAERGCRKELL